MGRRGRKRDGAASACPPRASCARLLRLRVSPHPSSHRAIEHRAEPLRGSTPTGGRVGHRTSVRWRVAWVGFLGVLRWKEGEKARSKEGRKRRGPKKKASKQGKKQMLRSEVEKRAVQRNPTGCGSFRPGFPVSLLQYYLKLGRKKGGPWAWAQGLNGSPFSCICEIRDWVGGGGVGGSNYSTAQGSHIHTISSLRTPDPRPAPGVLSVQMHATKEDDDG